MSGDPGDLSGLADLALPPAIPFWPPAAGVWIVSGGIAAMLGVVVWRAIRRHRADAYLRLAMREIDAAAPVEATSAVLKRAAMVAYGREQVASLTGHSWSSFLVETAHGVPVPALAEGLAKPFDTGDTADGEAVAAQARAWLRAQRGLVTRSVR